MIDLQRTFNFAEKPPKDIMWRCERKEVAKLGM